MPRPQRPWFRFYVEAVWDRKLRGLPAEQRWAWVAVLAIARSSPLPGVLMISDMAPALTADIADAAALPLRATQKALDSFLRLGMLAADIDTGALRVVAWDERQFESDNVTERTRLHRSREHGWNVPTPDDTDASVSRTLVRTSENLGKVSSMNRPLSDAKTLVAALRDADRNVPGTLPETETETETVTTHSNGSKSPRVKTPPTPPRGGR